MTSVNGKKTTASRSVLTPPGPMNAVVMTAIIWTMMERLAMVIVLYVIS